MYNTKHLTITPAGAESDLNATENGQAEVSKWNGGNEQDLESNCIVTELDVNSHPDPS